MRPVLSAGLLTCWLAGATALGGESRPADLARSLPDPEGWRRVNEPGRYGPQNLYEYIDGAAEGFLDCAFEELVTQIYEANDGRSVTVEVYRHRDPDAAFGIYSRERPRKGDFLGIGAEGYHEAGVLNFLKGSHYVKITSVELGAAGKDVLGRFASATAARLPGETRLPALLEAFPKDGRVDRSERYILKSFLGHPFFGPAFTVDYERDGKTFRLWAIAAATPADARGQLERYAASQGTAPPRTSKTLTVPDRFNGPVSVLAAGRYLLGALGADPAAQALHLEALSAALKRLDSRSRGRAERPARSP